MKILLIFTLCLISDQSYKKFIHKTVHVGGDLNVSCKYPESLRSNPKFFCKRLQNGTASVGRHSDQTLGNDQGVSLALCDYEEMKYAEHLIYTTVIFYSSATSSNDAAPSIKDEVLCDYTSVTYTAVPLDIVEYAEIKDNKCPSAPDAGTSTVYSNAQLPTIPSGQNIYSTVQLPRRLSTEELDEGLNYATLSFHSNATRSNDAVPQIKEDVSTDYASVRHVTSPV
ncbi:hypothetical protein KOW79_009605 [Hemibagrus wyckioides]|uniref:Uncharacterized protein n=1 Tax=Hemibagrus wyckioides TaxID=337641 RepID=A0A9D3NQ93_9TELE|nr:hypothetical protein KOW79_009605 [Hemibagrus wyckioides]